MVDQPIGTPEKPAKRYFAHSGTPGERGDWQPLPDHLHAVADLAAALARAFGLEKAAWIAGLLHDLGKYHPDFQRRLDGANLRVDHSTAGAAILIRRAKGMDAVMAELVAYAILGHHAGLPDKRSPENACFERRIEGFRDGLDPVWEREISPAFEGLMPADIIQRLATRGNHKPFDLSVIARFLFSCLVDADFRDTEAFYAAREGRQPDRLWTPLSSLLDDFTGRFDAHMVQVAGRAKGDRALNALRGEILAHVRAQAPLEPGLFTLTVPTGGGKTLASLGFALDHARRHGHRRIIYAVPFTSIVEQTAAIFSDVLGPEHILEHHSAIELEEEAEFRRETGRPPESRDRLKLAMEDWAAPIVVTTNVQLFESLFAARTSRARKFHNIAGSIIILDEAQTIPRHLLRPCVRMLDSLAHLFGCTIVLCTATQPALGAPRFSDGLALDGRELAPDPQSLGRRLRRTRIERVGPMDDEALVSALGDETQGLVIVNSRRHALDLFRAVQAADLEGAVHLTTRQCAAHRRLILSDIRERLGDGRPCRVIATSLIEAGVDVDFPRVWRAEAGWDQVMQAAGRCNREGLRPAETSLVTVFEPARHRPPPEIADLVGATMRALTKHGDDIQSLAAIEDYFREVYWQAGDRLDGRDKPRAILPRLAMPGRTEFAFRSIAGDFRMIDSTMQPVIVPFDDTARKAVEELKIGAIPSGLIARKLQTYLVLVPPAERARLIRNGHASFVRPDLRGDQFVVLATTGLYRDDVGLVWEEADGLGYDFIL